MNKLTITHCSRCYRILRNAKAIERGMGSSCWGKSGKNTGSKQSQRHNCKTDYEQQELPLVHHDHLTAFNHQAKEVTEIQLALEGTI